LSGLRARAKNFTFLREPLIKTKRHIAQIDKTMVPTKEKNSASAPRSYLIPYPVESFSNPATIFSGSASIGADYRNSIRLPHASVAPHHAQITFEKGVFYLHDLDSASGTFVNRKRIRKSAIKHHDKIGIGDQTFLFLLQPQSSIHLRPRDSEILSDTVSIGGDTIDPSELLARKAAVAASDLFMKPRIEDPTASEKLSAAHRRLSLLYQLSEKIRATSDLDRLLDQGVDFLLQAIPEAERAVIMLWSGSGGVLEIKALKHREENREAGAICISRTVMDWVLSEKMALVSQNVLDDQRFDESESIRVNSLNSIICVPMMSQDNVTGLIYADSSDILEPLTRDDAAFTAAVANELALCMDNIRLQKQAIVNERMAAIGLAISNLSHNIRNLIALNQNAVDLMGMHLRRMGNEKINRSWQRIEASFVRINNLSADMLEYAKDQQIQLKPVDVNKLIKGNCDFFNHGLANEQIQTELLLSRSNPKWVMDRDQFQRALLNLLVNAIYAIGPGKDGKITVTSTVEDEKRLMVGVSDDGCGIAPEKLDKIFELFYTTKGTEGSGLGLPMVKRFMEKMKGELMVQSRIGEGSTFKMIFPKFST
jgi:signal transduction histidine kinase